MAKIQPNSPRYSSESVVTFDLLDVDVKPDFSSPDRDSSFNNIPSISEQISRTSSRARLVEDEEENDWPSIRFMVILGFVFVARLSMFFATLWPFLNELDPNTDEAFLGYVVASYCVGQALAAPVAGWLSTKKAEHMKSQMVVCVVIMFCSSLIYALIPNFPQPSRKWFLIVARLVCGSGVGALNVLMRYHVVLSSSSKHRARAVSLLLLAYTSGKVLGPVIQAAFTPIGYPGYKWGFINFDMYTAAGFLSMFVDIIMVALIVLFFKQRKGMDGKKDRKRDPYYAMPKYDKFAILLCFITYFIMLTAFTTFETITTPYTMAMYSWDDSQGSAYNSIIMASQSFFAFFAYGAFAWKLGSRIDCRKGVIGGLLILFFYFLITFSWPFYTAYPDYKVSTLVNGTGDVNSSYIPHSLVVHNEPIVTPVGCQNKLEWCHTTTRVPLWFFLPLAVICSGFGLPTVEVPLMTLFSKILGPRTQGTVQGFMFQIGSVARVVGPVVLMQIFTHEGPRLLWIVVGTVMLIGVVPWFIFWKRMVPLKTKADMRSGDSFVYKKGILYRF